MAGEENFVTRFIKQVRENRLHKKYEQSVSPEKAYYAFDSDVRAHDREFQRMCPEGLQNWTESRKLQTGRTPAVLVLLGQVGIIRELGTAGVAVALVDDRDSTTKQVDLKNHRDFVEGDVLLYKDTFSKITKSLNRLGINSVDLVIVRGYQGNGWLTNDVNVQFKVLGEIIKLLDENGGTFMVHGGTNISQPVLNDSLSRLSLVPNLEVEHFENHYGLTTDVKITKRGRVDLKK